MKNILKLLVIIPFIFSVSFAQNFFPTNVGNLYQMDNHWDYWAPGGYYDSGLDYYKYSLISDTLIDDSRYFKPNKMQYLNPFDFDCYLRFDSLEQRLYIFLPIDSSTHIAVDFIIPADSHYTTYITGEARTCKSFGVYYDTLFSNLVQASSLEIEDDGFDSRKFYFADKIGLYKYHVLAGDIFHGSNIDQNLISAKIDSLIYNPISLSIDSVYPVIDRPVNTFPYLMWIYHHESYKALIDTFYIEIQHVRVDSVLETKFNNILLTNSNTTIYFDSLKAGDIVQFKILLSDSSIFLNKFTYPDTGWVKINILPAITNINNEYIDLKFSLEQNFPNPFNPSTNIQYAISSRQFVTLKVYDVLGKEIATLINEEKPAGSFNVDFNAPYLASGIYYYRLKAGGFIETKKMVLMK